MKRKRYTAPQIVFALQQAEAGTPAAEICRKMGVAAATFHRRESGPRRYLGPWYRHRASATSTVVGVG